MNVKGKPNQISFFVPEIETGMCVNIIIISL